MKLDQYLMGFIIFSLIVVSGVLIIQDVNTNYDLDMSTEEFNSTYNTIDSMYNISQDQNDDVLGQEIDEEDPIDSAVTGSYSAIRLIYSTYDLIGNIIRDIASTLHIPAFFITFALTALTISIMFGIIYLFVRFRPWLTT